jgi:hypothetical protein
LTPAGNSEIQPVHASAEERIATTRDAVNPFAEKAGAVGGGLLATGR